MTPSPEGSYPPPVLFSRSSPFGGAGCIRLSKTVRGTDQLMGLESTHKEGTSLWISMPAQLLISCVHFLGWPSQMTTAGRLETTGIWGAWVAQLVQCPTSAQVMISRFGSSSPTQGSLLSPQSLFRILCAPLCLCPSPNHALPPSRKKQIDI